MYPQYLQDSGTWLDGAAGRSSPAAAALRSADAAGMARGSDWFVGAAEKPAAAEPEAEARQDEGAGPSGRPLFGKAPQREASAYSTAATGTGRKRSVPLPKRRPDREWKVGVR